MTTSARPRNWPGALLWVYHGVVSAFNICMEKNSKRMKGDERRQPARLEGVVRNKGIKPVRKPKASKAKKAIKKSAKK